ncbi:hypothetical protein QBC44DRAFT_263292 [Cladorrhinum sp. PSN332]|nr:hypothetical protein QBC44DRAFT_263292 [Cladorrhinum sp. PSN332]
MKSFMVFALAAAGVEATFKNASPFKCPANTDNKCTPKQVSGFDWNDLNLGGFANYNDFSFNGWSCGSSGSGGRFSGQPGGKFISGTCHSDKGKSPSFGCGPAVDKFSLGSIKVEPEFDCDLEFHYEMPDGSSCKHRNACKKSGTVVKNTQCGGAKKVTIVYPPQPNKPKKSCSVKVPTVSFDCSTASSTKPVTSTKKSSTSILVTTTSEVKTTSTTAAATTSVPAETTSSVSPGETTTATVPDESTVTTAPGESTTVTLPAEETTSVSPGESTTVPAEETTATVPGAETTTAPAPGEETTTAPAPGEETTTATVPGEETTSVSPGETTTAPVEEPTTTAPAETVTLSTPITTVITTEFESTSTIFSTVVSTITQCEPTVPDCPVGGGVTTTVATVVVSTTICPVTETLTTVISTSVIPAQPTSAPAGGETTVVAPGESTVVVPGESTVVAPGVTSAPAGATSTAGVPTTIATSIKPVETLPCPSVVPSCLNTFLFSVGCQDNTDTECYCPDAIFVKSVYDCLYAHGESDQIISEAVIFFQGICAPWVDKNPAVVTAPTVTSYITVTAAPTVAPVYTTIVIDATTVEPCTDDAGEIIPGSSTTVVIATTVPVPQVGFTTGTAGVVDVVPITAAPIFNGGEGSNGGGAVITGNGTTITVPTGTGSVRPTQSVVLAGSNRVGTSFGFAAGIALLAAFGL